MAAEPTFIFDACAVVALLHQEAGAEVVAEILENDENLCLIHAINACEVYYDLYLRGGDAGASPVQEILERNGLVLDASIAPDFWQTAGRLKAQWRRVSLADCFALVLTIRKKGTLVTSDHHELDRIAQANLCPIRFIR